MDSITKGNLGELAVATDLASRGFTVCFPFGTSRRWDLIFTRDGSTFERVQVKALSARDGIARIPCKNVARAVGNVGRITPYTADETDWIAAFEMSQRQCYYVPSTDFKKSAVVLKLDTERAQRYRDL